MYKLIFFILFFFCLSYVIGQNASPDSNRVTINLQNSTKLETDTLKIQTIAAENSKQPWYQSNSMPWIIALLISIFTVFINIFIAKINVKSASNNIEKQIQFSTITANKQIDANRETTLRQFNATLNTSNRQEWVTDVRNVLSDLITQGKSLNIAFQENYVDVEKRKELHDKVTYNHVKLLLLLDPNKDRHIPTLQALVDFMNTLDKHLLTSNAKQKGQASFEYDNSEFIKNIQKVVDEGRKLLYAEWSKIQTLV